MLTGTTKTGPTKENLKRHRSTKIGTTAEPFSIELSTERMASKRGVYGIVESGWNKKIIFVWRHTEAQLSRFSIIKMCNFFHVA